jgi:3-hydroxyisobutyrate dehydrogenase
MECRANTDRGIDMAKLAFIGLGVMGGQLAKHLAAAGHELTVYNRTRAKADTWVSEYGGRAVDSPAELQSGLMPS